MLIIITRTTTDKMTKAYMKKEMNIRYQNFHYKNQHKRKY